MGEAKANGHGGKVLELDMRGRGRALPPPRSVAICIIVPNPGGVTPDTEATWLRSYQIWNELDVGWYYVPQQGLGYEHALAEVCASAMQLTPAKDFFFLDADIAFDPAWLVLMCQMEQDIVCGTYQQRTSPQDWCLNTTQNGLFRSEIIADPLTGAPILPIDDTGFGAVRVRRRCIEAMQKAHPELSYHSFSPRLPEPAFALWDPWIFEHAGRRRRCAGDTNWFQRAKRLGFQAWALPDMPINHARMGLKSLSQWVAEKKGELVSLEQAGDLGDPCCKCAEQPAPMFTRDGKRLCRQCALKMETGEQSTAPPAPSSLAGRLSEPAPEGPIDPNDGDA